MKSVLITLLLMMSLDVWAATNAVAPLIIVGKKDPNAPVTPYWMMPGYRPHNFQIARYQLPWEQATPAANQPNGQIGQANNAIGQTTIGIGQPMGALGQPNNAIGQPNVGIGQANNQIGQTRIGIGQPTIGIGQPYMQLGQPTIGIGQSTIGIGQPTIAIGQPTIGIGQPTIGIGQPNTGIGQPPALMKTPPIPSRDTKKNTISNKPPKPEHRRADPQPKLKLNPKPQVSEERSAGKRER